MVATPARIGFVMEPVRRVTAESPDVFARHGSLARRDDEPLETFFASVAHAQIMADERQELLSPERRRFSVTVRGLGEVLALPIAGPVAPEARYVDAERGIERSTLVAEVGFDFANQQGTLVVWG